MIASVFSLACEMLDMLLVLLLPVLDPRGGLGGAFARSSEEVFEDEERLFGLTLFSSSHF